MKITKSKLKRIITEELQNILAEVDPTKVLDPVEMAKKRQADREARADRIRKRAEHLERARRLMGVLYPGSTREEMAFTIKQNNDEGTLTNSLFGFLVPTATTMDKPNPYLMDRVEEWIKTRSGEEETALEIAGRSKPENLESLLTYIEDKGMELGKAEFEKAKAHGEKSPARNVPVGKAATPGTPERAALDALMSAEVPPKRRR
mgnify:CR=1 FL=1